MMAALSKKHGVQRRWIRAGRGVLFILTFGMMSLSAAEGQTTVVGTEPKTTLTTVQAVISLSGKEAAEGKPVRLEGRVIYANPTNGEMLFRDATGVIRLNLDLNRHPVRAGQWAVLQGLTKADFIRFPDHPSGGHYLTSFEAPINVGHSFMAKISGYIHPPVTGEYTFWIASDNLGELRLSPDEDPKHAVRIAEGTDYTASRAWEKLPNQRSKKIILQADRKYYIEASQWEEFGQDCVAVAWQGPGLPRSIIAGEYLSPPLDATGSQAPNARGGSVLREFWIDYPFTQEMSDVRIDGLRPTIDSIFSIKLMVFGAPGISVAQLIGVADKPLGEAGFLAMEQTWPTKNDFDWVQMEGLVSQVSDDSSYWTKLELTEDTRRVTVRLPNPERKSFQHLLHARLAIKGFCEGALGQKGERIASILWVPDLLQLSLKEPVNDDWSLLPAVSLRELNAKSFTFRDGQRIKLLGRVLEGKSGRSVIVRDSVSQFSSFTSSDGENWNQVGDAIEIATDRSVHMGLVVLSPGISTEVVFDKVSIDLPVGKGTDVGQPSWPGRSRWEGEKIVLNGSGHIGGEGGFDPANDDFYFLSNPLNGDGSIVARVLSVTPRDAPYPGAEGGIMLRSTLESGAAFSYLAVNTVAGLKYRGRRGKGSSIEYFPDGKTTPLWMKVQRASATPIEVQLLQDAEFTSDQTIEIMGVLERSDDRWKLKEAFYRSAARVEKKLPTGTGPEIVSVAQMRQLSSNEIRERKTVKIRGVVTARAADLFIQDSTGGVRIASTNYQKFAHCKPGQYIEVIGSCLPGLYSPVIVPDQQSAISILGKGEMPPPRSATWHDLIRVRDDAQWIELKGVIRSIKGRLLKLQMLGGYVLADLPTDLPQAHIDKLIDSTVRIHGVCSVMANEKNQFSGVRLIVPSAEFIMVDEAPLSDPFTIPVQSIGSLLKFEEQSMYLHRVKVQGVVTYAGENFGIIQDTESGVEVSGFEHAVISPGDGVEVVGFLDSNGSSLTLGDALIRRTGRVDLPKPWVVEPAKSPTAIQNLKLITVSAVYLGQSPSLHNQVFQFQRGGRVFQAILAQEQAARLEIDPGSTVSLTGVCRAVTDRAQRSLGSDFEFEMLLSSAAHMSVLQKPDWWNLKRLLWIGTIFVGVLAISATWIATILRKNRLLRIAQSELQKGNDELERRVVHRTADLASANSELSHEQALLRALLDSSPDEIYFKDTQSRYLKASQAQADNFGVKSPNEMVGKTDLDFFGEGHAGPSYKDEQEIVRTGRPMIGQIHREVRKNGQMHWMLSSKMPLRNRTNDIVGTFGVSKDISDIKEAEAKLAGVHQQLVDTSHQAGMAEVATSVLHNVGNVLNSVNVSATVVSDRVRQSRVTNVGRVSDLLEQHSGDLASFVTKDPRGQKLPAYLRTLADKLTGEQQELLKELENMCKNVGHIKEIVAMQQSYAQVSGVTETVQLTDLVEDALRMDADSFGRHRVTFCRDYLAQPTLTVEKNKVIQILVNLLKNAKHACEDSDRKEKIVTVQIRTEADRVEVAMIDNGVGISPENLTRIFAHGFTTRKEGHGFGLHSGALAAIEMGGSLKAYSDGLGTGAKFVLELPLAPAARS